MCIPMCIRVGVLLFYFDNEWLLTKYGNYRRIIYIFRERCAMNEN